MLQMNGSVDKRQRKSFKQSIEYYRLKRKCKELQLYQVQSHVSSRNDLRSLTLNQEKTKAIEVYKSDVFTKHGTFSNNLLGRNLYGFEDEDDLADKSADQSTRIDYVQQAIKSWDSSICEELNLLAVEQGLPLVAGKTEPLVETESETAHDFDKQIKPAIRFLFDSEDLYDAVMSVNNSKNRKISHHWYRISLRIKSMNFQQLKSFFNELHPSEKQIGIDSVMNAEYVNHRLRVDSLCLLNNDRLKCKNYLKRGVLSSSRPLMWRMAGGMDLAVTPTERAYYKQLNSYSTCRKSPHYSIQEALFVLDFKHTANDARYFVFEDTLRGVLLAFCRDHYIASHCAVLPLSPFVADSGDLSRCVPNCGVQPHRGLVMYAAPLAFVYSDECELYYMFRLLYTKYWCKLNSLRADDSMLLHLCVMFENLIQSLEPALLHHLKRVDVSPLQLAFPWIQLAFSSYLEVEQVLLLWDRVLGLDSLYLLPVLAAAIFSYRSVALLKTNTKQEVLDLMADGTNYNVIALLQSFLFHDELCSHSD